MISLSMIVVDEFRDHVPKMSLCERDDPIEALALDREDEPLGERVEIGTPRRKPDDLHAGAFEGSAKLDRVERIPVEHQEDVVPNQPGRRHDLDREEVRCGNHTEVGATPRRPR